MLILILGDKYYVNLYKGGETKIQEHKEVGKDHVTSSVRNRVRLQVSFRSNSTFNLLIPRNGFQGDFRNLGKPSEALFLWGPILLHVLFAKLSLAEKNHMS